jgi:hypothetical protein
MGLSEGLSERLFEGLSRATALLLGFMSATLSLFLP